MKFERIIIKNFMRYKGTNTIAFSCEPQKNVTVILGDNTVGKTTIAQAFRWGLYGAIFAERGRNPDNYQLLNNDVLSLMDANSRAGVSVELVARDGEKRYDIYREVIYARKFPQMAVKELIKKKYLKISEIGHEDAEIEVEEGQIEHVINELFPKSLSHYFLFDGERWNDVTVNGVKENIRDSVHILTGLSAYQAALWHLKDMGSNSVIRKYKSKITGNGNLYDSLEKDRGRLERAIEKHEEEIKTLDINIENFSGKYAEIETYLADNRDTEALQKEYRQLLTVQRAKEERAAASYKSLVNEFSDKAYMMFAQPLIAASVKMVKKVAGERRDIPHMRQGTIDYIIKTGRCICGTPLRSDSEELACLMEQRNYLPPADIGSLLGEFERTGMRWERRCHGKYAEFHEEAANVDESIRDDADTCNQIAAMERRMESEINFSEKRRQLKGYEAEIKKLSFAKGQQIGEIAGCRRQIEHIENEMARQEEQSSENAKWRIRLELAETIYARMKKDFAEREKKTFLELNEQIQRNFERMFNAKDKKIQLTSQYEIQMLYQTGSGGFREEKNLSEGEKIARNFAFIVTIMEYSRRKREEREVMKGAESDTLPIVLDGPFSKLGDENIHLIASVLPEVSEQVIVFMLKKDWRYTGLDPYVGEAYEIDKRADESFASIRKAGGK